MDYLIAEERNRFPVLKNNTYLLTQSTGLIPDYVYEAVKIYQDDRYTKGGDSIWRGMSTLEMMDFSKKQLAAMIGCKARNIAFGDNSSRMLNLFINGIGLERGDNVVICEDAFINNKYAWQMKEMEGIEIRYVKSEKGIVMPEQIMDMTDENTKSISICHVESGTGFRHNLQRIGSFCRQRKHSILRGWSSTLGVLPVDVEKCRLIFWSVLTINGCSPIVVQVLLLSVTS